MLNIQLDFQKIKLKISTRFGELSQVIAEAATWAKLAKAKVVTTEYIDKALEERKNRQKKYDERYTQMIKDGTLLIDTEGEKSRTDKRTYSNEHW